MIEKYRFLDICHTGNEKKKNRLQIQTFHLSVTQGALLHLFLSNRSRISTRTMSKINIYGDGRTLFMYLAQRSGVCNTPAYYYIMYVYRYPGIRHTSPSPVVSTNNDFVNHQPVGNSRFKSGKTRGRK